MSRTLVGDVSILEILALIFRHRGTMSMEKGPLKDAEDIASRYLGSQPAKYEA